MANRDHLWDMICLRVPALSRKEFDRIMDNEMKVPVTVEPDIRPVLALAEALLKTGQALSEAAQDLLRAASAGQTEYADISSMSKEEIVPVHQAVPVEYGVPCYLGTAHPSHFWDRDSGTAFCPGHS